MCRVFIGEGVFVGAFFHSYTLSIISELIGIIRWFIFMGVYWMTMTVSQLYFGLFMGLRQSHGRGKGIMVRSCKTHQGFMEKLRREPVCALFG